MRIHQQHTSCDKSFQTFPPTFRTASDTCWAWRPGNEASKYHKWVAVLARVSQAQAAMQQQMIDIVSTWRVFSRVRWLRLCGIIPGLRLCVKQWSACSSIMMAVHDKLACYINSDNVAALFVSPVPVLKRRQIGVGSASVRSVIYVPMSTTRRGPGRGGVFAR